MKLTSKIRMYMGLDHRYNRVPIEVVNGYDSPKLMGKSFYWANKSGQRIYAPTAYAKKGFSSMIYHSSTKRIEVGEGWLRCYGLLK